MVHSYKFALLALHAPAPRDERLNVGVVVFRDSDVDVRLLRSLRKLTALSLAFGDDTVRTAAENLRALDARIASSQVSVDGRAERLSRLSPFKFSGIGEFVAASQAAYEAEIALIMRSFVEPEAGLRVMQRGKGTPLSTALRKSFRADRILAAKGEDLSSHRVLSNVELATGLIADFVLKNGAMHIFETVDASSETLSPVAIAKNVGLSAITIEQARIKFGDAITVPRLIYQASATTEALVTPSLLAAEHQGVELVNWSSDDDQRRLRVTVSSLATPLPKRKAANTPLNATVQPRFALN